MGRRRLLHQLVRSSVVKIENPFVHTTQNASKKGQAGSTSEQLRGKDGKSKEKSLPTHNTSGKGQEGSSSEKLHGKDEKSGSPR